MTGSTDGAPGQAADRVSGTGPARLDLLKTLGDNTRYAIYLELARSPVPLSTADIAATLTTVIVQGGKETGRFSYNSVNETDVPEAVKALQKK